jgi:hypothetical protein
MSFGRVFKPESLDIDQLAFEIKRLLTNPADQGTCAGGSRRVEGRKRGAAATAADLLSGGTRGTNVSREVPIR